MQARFVADVGGTNIRLAQEVNGEITAIRKYLCADYPDIADVIRMYFASYPGVDFTHGCIDVACPVNDDWVNLTNNHWAFSKSGLKQSLALEQLCVINDYTAVSMCLPVLNNAQRQQIGGGQARKNATIAVFGPGTGLGVSHLVPVTEGWMSLDGEGGHVDFAPQDDDDFMVWRFLRKVLPHVSAEEVLSGRGIVHIYQAFADAGELEPKYTDPADITAHALDGSCELCDKTLQQFCRIMGSFAGNLALNLGAFGGVYIAGGIVQRFADYLANSDFRQRFEAKGRFQSYVADIPTFVITEPDHGLIGAAAYLEQHLRG